MGTQPHRCFPLQLQNADSGSLNDTIAIACALLLSSVALPFFAVFQNLRKLGIDFDFSAEFCKFGVFPKGESLFFVFVPFTKE